MLTSKAIFYEFPTRKKIWVPSHNFVKKNVLCEKGDEITRFDGISYNQIIYKYVTVTVSAC